MVEFRTFLFQLVTSNKSRNFHVLGGLKSHMSTHSGVKPYFCEVCGASFTKTYSLAKHKRIHSGEKPVSISTFVDSLNTNNTQTVTAAE